MSLKISRNRLHTVLVSILSAICLFSSSVAYAADESTESPETPEPLTVRDASVFLLSAYGTTLNDRGLFKSTLPGYTLSRRPSAARSDANTPSPVSLITFSGPPSEDIDVLLEFDNGRFLSHWPPARMRSKRLLWASLSTSVDALEAPARMAEDHWLSPLRENDRLYAASRGRCDRGLIYDAELKFVPHVTLDRINTNFQVKNSGEFPVHDVHVYRPAENGQWNVWSAETVGRSKKVKKSKDEQESEDGEDSPEEVFDKTEEDTSEAKDGSAEGDDDTSEGKDESTEGGDESLAETDQPAEGEEQKASPGQKAGLTAFIAKVKAGELPSSGKGKDSDDDSTKADATDRGTISTEEVLQTWTQRLHELGLGDAEANHITTILKGQALRTDETMVVYRMDEAQLEKLLPLEVTPYPDRLFRVALVIVQDADPDLQSQIDELVKQLGNDEWPLREAAQGELAELGLAAKPKLEEALKSEDAEVVFRAEQLLEEIQLKP